MTEQQIRAVLLDVLAGIAPEVDPATIEPGVDLRSQLDIDSMDFLNYVIGVCDRLKIDVPEVDYPKMCSLDEATTYLRAKFGA